MLNKSLKRERKERWRERERQRGERDRELEWLMKFVRPSKASRGKPAR